MKKHYRTKKHYRDYAKRNFDKLLLTGTGYGVKTMIFYFDLVGKKDLNLRKVLDENEQNIIKLEISLTFYACRMLKD